MYYVGAGFINSHQDRYFAAYGDVKEGEKELGLKDLTENPIVKVKWSAAFTNNIDPDFLGRTTGFEITEKNGKVSSAVSYIYMFPIEGY